MRHGLHWQIAFPTVCHLKAAILLLRYCHSWQWRYINLHATCTRRQQKLWNKHGLLWLLRRNDPIKMNCYCGKTQKRQNFGTHVFALLYAKESRFATVPSWLNTCVLRARFPVRRDVSVSEYNKETTIYSLCGISILRPCDICQQSAPLPKCWNMHYLVTTAPFSLVVSTPLKSKSHWG